MLNWSNFYWAGLLLLDILDILDYYWAGWGCGFIATADGRMGGIFPPGFLAQSGKDLANLVVTH